MNKAMMKDMAAYFNNIKKLNICIKNSSNLEEFLYLINPY